MEITMNLPFVFVTVLLFPGAISLERSFRPNGHEIRSEVSSLFTSMSRKSSPLYICDPDVGGIEWLPPMPLNCDLEGRDNDTAKVVSITLFFTDVSQQVYEGFECSATETIEEGYKTFFSSDWTITKTTESIKVSLGECKDMVEKKVSPTGKDLIRISGDLYETGFLINRTHTAYFLADGYNETKTNYRIQKVTIGISSIDDTIQTTALTLSPCYSNASNCATKNGFILWKGSEIKTCRLKEGQESNCILRVSDKNMILTCPDQKLSLHNVEFLVMCGEKFGYSQGIFFLQNKKNEISQDLAVPSMVRGLITRPRMKRDISSLHVHPFEAEIKANLNFLYETVKKGTAEAIWKLEKKVCEANKAQLDLIIALSHSGHPALTAKLLHPNDLSYRADFSGDVPTIYKCLEVYEYMFQQRTHCMFEWPVSFLYNQKVLQGYMAPVTHTIIANPTNRTKAVDKCSRFYFKTEDYTVLLSNNVASLVNLPVLPQPSNAAVNEESLPPLSFVPSGNLDANSADVGTVFQMVREMQQREEKTTLVSAVEEHFVDQSHFAFMDGFGTFFGGIFSGFASIFGFLLLPLCYLAFAVVIIMLLSCTGMFPVVAMLPFRICYMFRFSNVRRSIKNIRKFFGLKNRKRMSAENRQQNYAPSAPVSYLGNGSGAWGPNNATTWHASGNQSWQSQEGQNWQSQSHANWPAMNAQGNQPWHV